LPASTSPLAGYRIKLLTKLYRKKRTSDQGAQISGGRAASGKSLVVYDPAVAGSVDVFPCEDGHAQERSPATQRSCKRLPRGCLDFGPQICGTVSLPAHPSRGAIFVIREHKKLSLAVS